MVVGKKPHPTNLKILNGNPGKRPLPKNEPKPTPIAPRCPQFLHKDAKREWKRIVPELERLGLLTVVDMAALVGYCESWAQYKEAIEFIHDNGSVYELERKEGGVYLQQYPQVSIANKALLQIRAFCTEFGMTPSSRARMSVPGAEDPDDGMEKLLRKTR